MLSDTSYPILPFRDLYFTLGTPVASLKMNTAPGMWDLVQLKLSTPNDEKDHNSAISKRIQEITLLKEIYFSEQSHAILKTISFSLLPNKISSCLSDFLKGVKDKKWEPEVVQKIYLLAQDLKRHVSNRSILWDALPKVDRLFLHQLALWSEDLHVLKDPIYYQWLGDGDIARAKQDEETMVDFGDGRLFKVLPPSTFAGESAEFPLARYPGKCLVKASPDQKQSSWVNLISADKKVNSAAIGRMAEIFDLQALEEAIQKEERKSILFSNQFTDLFSCYRSALCSVLDVPVRLPLAMGRQGEWVVWNHKKKQWNGQPFSRSMIADLHRLLQIEKVWKINIFNHPSSFFTPPVFAICDDRLFVDEVYPLPSFLMSDVQDRHGDLISRFNLDDEGHKELNRLRERAVEEEERERDIVCWLNMLVNRKSLTLQDLTDLDPQALLIVRLMRLIGKRGPLPNPLPSPFFFNTAHQMLSGLISTSGEPYSSQQIAKNKGMHLTNLILNSKKELRDLMFLFLVEKFEKKASVGECVETLIQIAEEKCREIAAELKNKISHNWPLKESLEEHFMLLFGEELFDELNQMMKQSSDHQSDLFAKLALLREAAAFPQADIQAINHSLESVLHDAMVQKYSQAFLADMQQLSFMINSTNLSQGDN